MVDSSHSRRDHGKKRHHHHSKPLVLEDGLDDHSHKVLKRISDYSPSPDRDEGQRYHHSKTKKHKSGRDEERDSRSRPRRKDSPKESRSDTHHPVRIKEEPLSPRTNEDNSKSRIQKSPSHRSHRPSHSSGKRGHNEDSPDAEVARRIDKNHHSNESNSRGGKSEDQRRDRGNWSNKGFKKDKRKLGTFSPSDDAKFEWGKKGEEEPEKAPADKEKPNFALSGKLTEDRNMYNGVVIKYSEPPEARKPKRRWRLYPFKGDEALPMMHIHRQSAFLLGRDRKVVDIPIDHPSCSKQHAALQYRLVAYQREDGTTGKRIRPYIIDLTSANGTYVNNNKIEPKKYVELLERDVIKFGYSSREYVLLHEGSKDEDDDE